MERGAGARRPHVVYRYIVAQRGGSACSAFAATLSALLTLAGVALVVLSQTGHIQLHGPPPAASSDNHNKDNDKQVVQVATSATEQEKKGWFRRYVRDQPVTTALVLANTIQFVRARDWDNFLSAPHAPTTVSLGSVQGVSPGRALKQIVGAAFHHGSFQHFALNMRALWSFGAVVERDLGSLKMLTVYLAGVLSGTLTDFAYQQRGKSRWNPVVGASGGIVALMGANGVTWPLSGTLGPALVQVVLLALFDGQKLKYMEALTDSEVIPEALRQVSHLSHLGGWVVGIAFAKMGDSVAAPAVGALLAVLVHLVGTGATQPMRGDHVIKMTGRPLPIITGVIKDNIAPVVDAPVVDAPAALPPPPPQS